MTKTVGATYRVDRQRANCRGYPLGRPHDMKL